MKKDATQAMFEYMCQLGENADIEEAATIISKKYKCQRNDLKTRYRAKAKKYGAGYYDFSRAVKKQIKELVKENVLTAKEIATKLKKAVTETTKIARQYGYKRTTIHNRIDTEDIDNEREQMQKMAIDNILFDLGLTKEEVAAWQKSHLV